MPEPAPRHRMPDIGVKANHFPIPFAHFNATTRLAVSRRDYLPDPGGRTNQ